MVGGEDERSEDAPAETTSPPLRQPCAFFLKTGSCAFGDQCKFEHPADQPPTQYNSLGLPLRPGEPDCAYYVKNLHCGYGASCKFHHAEPVVGWVSVPMMEGAPLNTRTPTTPMAQLQQPRGALGVNSAYPMGQMSGPIVMNPQQMLSAQPYNVAMMQQQHLMIMNQQGGGPPLQRSSMPASLPSHITYPSPYYPTYLQRGSTPSSLPSQMTYQPPFYSPQMLPRYPGPSSSVHNMGMRMPSQHGQVIQTAIPQQGSSISGPVLQSRHSGDSQRRETSSSSRPTRTGTASGGPSRLRSEREKNRPRAS